MSIHEQPLANNIYLIEASGRLDQPQTSQLEALLQRLLAEGHTQLAIDMAEVTYINSGGLRCLVTAWRQARQQGGNLVLFSLTTRVAEVFEMVGFDKVFQIFDDRSQALSVFES